MKLADDVWTYLLDTEPTYATYLYQEQARGNDRLPDIGPERRARDVAAFRAFQGRLAEEPDLVTRDIIARKLGEGLGEIEFAFHESAVDHLTGPHVWLLELPSYTPPSLHDALRARIEAFPRYMDQYLENLRDGVRSGRTAPRASVERVRGQLRDMLAKPPDQNPLKAPDLVEKCVHPALRRFAEFLETYRGRDDAGIWATPGGDAAYAFKIGVHTSDRFDAKTLHQMGLDELARLRAGVGKTDLAAIRRDGAQYFQTREQIVGEYKRILAKVDALLPKYFSRLPRTGYDVLPTEPFAEKDATLGHYHQPDLKGTRPGRFYANTYKPETRAKFDMAALAAHEAVPGHHLQVALAMELEGLPEIRRYGGFTAYVEGWALYAERLADTMGVYETDLDRVGMLIGQMRRAIRLVVDTGLHAMRWSRRKAITFEVDAVQISEEAAANDIDRYAAWPGQALAYMVGRLEIERLRDEAKQALGPRFDLRAFHDVVLGSGAVPLETLEAIVRRWTGGARRS